MDRFVININATTYYQRNGSINDQTYMINSSSLPAGNYKCKLAYRGLGEAGSVLSPAGFAAIYLSVGPPIASYSAGDVGALQNSQLVAFSRTELLYGGTAAYNWCSYDDCPPFYINYKPGDLIRVILRSGISMNTLYSGANAYFMMIEFVKLAD